MDLTENQKYILAHGLARGEEQPDGSVKGGYLTYDDAVLLYSAKDVALSALNTLRMKGYIKLTSTPGVFTIARNLPPDIFVYAANLRTETKDRAGGDKPGTEETSLKTPNGAVK